MNLDHLADLRKSLSGLGGFDYMADLRKSLSGLGGFDHMADLKKSLSGLGGFDHMADLRKSLSGVGGFDYLADLRESWQLQVPRYVAALATSPELYAQHGARLSEAHASILATFLRAKGSSAPDQDDSERSVSIESGEEVSQAILKVLALVQASAQETNELLQNLVETAKRQPGAVKLIIITLIAGILQTAFVRLWDNVLEALSSKGSDSVPHCQQRTSSAANRSAPPSRATRLRVIRETCEVRAGPRSKASVVGYVRVEKVVVSLERRGQYCRVIWMDDLLIQRSGWVKRSYLRRIN